LTFNHISPADLESVWAFVDCGLRQIQRKCGQLNWTAGQVKNLVLAGKAGLFLHPDGFVILEPDHEPLSFKPFLNVWLAWFRPGKAKTIRAQLVAWLDAQAMQMVGTKDWRFSSPRLGWANEIEPFCEIHMMTWRRKE
jgi:hypothetical protein